jgi:broad specificity phosphatase PhoE
VAIEITFIRHGETDANAASIWQGQGDAALSVVGRRQAHSLQERLSGTSFDEVVASDLVRTIETADLAGLDPELDPAWREMDIGAWEGLTRDEVHERFPSEIERLRAGDQDVRMGGGETWGEFGERIAAAIHTLTTRVEPGSRVAVIAHGGVIHAALAWGLGFRGRRPWPVSRILNAGITEVVANEGFHLQYLNDARHVPVVTGNQDEVGTPVALIRHGQTHANVAGRWHGRTDGPLTSLGERQGSALAARYNGIVRVYSSPLERTRRTAEAFAEPSGLTVETADDLVEADFGAWEDLTTSEIEDRFTEEFVRVFRDGDDLARGGTGETFAAVAQRMERQIRALADQHPTERLALFTHGGAIWALALEIIGVGWSGWNKLAIPSNVSATHLRFDGGSPILVDYNLPLQ